MKYRVKSKSKLLWVVMLLTSLSMTFTANAQSSLDSYRDSFLLERAPLFMKLSIVQKSFKSPTFTFTDEPGVIEFSRIKGGGGGLAFEFAINKTRTYHKLITAEIGYNQTSYAVRGRAVVDGRQFGLENDVNGSIFSFLGCSEGYFRLNRYKQINSRGFLRLGLGVNVQSVPIAFASIQAIAFIPDGGVNERVVLVSTSEQVGFFGDKNFHTLNPIFSIGYGHQFKQKQMMLFDLRICNSGTIDMTKEMTSGFGLNGLLDLNKSFVGLDISYLFAINQKGFF